MNYASFIKSSSGVKAVTKLLAANNSSLSRLTNIAGEFSCASAIWITSMGVREAVDWIWLAKSIVMSLGTSMRKSELILVISVSICVLAIFLSLLRNVRNSIILVILVAPFNFLFWIVSRISSTAGHKGLALCDSLSWVSQLIKTSVSRKIRLLDSTIAGIAHRADDFGRAFAFSQGRLKFSRQRFNDIHRLDCWNLAHIRLKRLYCFLKSRTHGASFSFWKNYIIPSLICQVNRGKKS